MLDIVKREIDSQIDEWNREVHLLHRRGAEASANALHSAMGDLRALWNRIEAKASRLSVQDYAAQHGIQPDTVRRWVRAGQLPAAKGADGQWSIPYGAQRRKLRRVA